MSQNPSSDLISILLSRGQCTLRPELLAKVNVNDEVTLTPLMIAIAMRKVDACEALLKSGADANGTVGSDTCLSIACKSGVEKIVSLLLSYKADIGAVDGFMDTSLHIAVRNGNDAIVSTILKGIGKLPKNEAGTILNAQNSTGETALYIAILGKYVNSVSGLLKARADVNIKCQSNETPLLLACKLGHTHYVNLLCTAGADVNVCDEHNNTALHFASEKGNLKITQALLRNNAYISIVNADQFTPIQIAKEKGYSKMVDLLHTIEIMNIPNAEYTPQTKACNFGNIQRIKFLLECGADPNVLGTKALSPQVALMFCKHPVETLKPIVRLLVEYKADVNMSVVEGKDLAAVCIAVRRSRTDYVELLLDNNASLQPTQELSPAMEIALCMNDCKMVSLLLHNKALIDQSNANGAPLVIAVRQNYTDLAILQIDSKANVNAPLPNGLGTVLHLAVVLKNIAIVKHLVSNMANVNPLTTAPEGHATPLDFAIMQDSPQIIEYLVSNNAYANLSKESLDK